MIAMTTSSSTRVKALLRFMARLVQYDELQNRNIRILFKPEPKSREKVAEPGSLDSGGRDDLSEGRPGGGWDQRGWRQTSALGDAVYLRGGMEIHLLSTASKCSTSD